MGVHFSFPSLADLQELPEAWRGSHKDVDIMLSVPIKGGGGIRTELSFKAGGDSAKSCNLFERPLFSFA